MFLEAKYKGEISSVIAEFGDKNKSVATLNNKHIPDVIIDAKDGKDDHREFIIKDINFGITERPDMNMQIKNLQ